MVEVREATSTADGPAPRGSRRPRWPVFVGAAAIVLVLAVAVRFVAGADDRALRDSLVGRRFVVSSITEDGEPKVLVGPALLGEPAIGLISFGDEYVSASGGCNSTGRGFGVTDGRLVVSDQGSTTTAACSQEVMAQDNWFDSFLRASPTITLVGDRLTLATASTTIELVERAAPPDPPAPPPPTALDPALLTGRNFVATGALVGGVERRIVGSDDEPEPHRLRITFGDGTVSVTAGCNSGDGPYTLDQGRIGGLAITTERACPPELMDQDIWLNELFSTSPSLTLDGDYLALGNQTDTVMIFVDEAAAHPAVAPSPFAGTRWDLDSAATPDVPTPDEVPYEAYLIVPDGRQPNVYLRDGCNVVTGDVRVEATSDTTGTITMGELDRTDASCPPPIDQVVEVMTAIQTGDWTYVIDIDRLELRQGDRSVAFSTT